MESPYYFPIDVKRSRLSVSSKKKSLGTRPPVKTSVRLPSMPNIPGCRVLKSGDADYDSYLKAYNQRTIVKPALRAVCTNAEAVSGIVDWVRRNGMPFAVRSGGHSFEGCCNNSNVVIDVRNLNQIDYDPQSKTVTIGAGANLGSIYSNLNGHGKDIVFAAGTCPTVGIAGHVLGGGYGFLARAFGLTCDNLLSLTMVDANSNLLEASEATNPDLFWASRGGGGGTFGIATEFKFKTHRVVGVYTFTLTWSLNEARAKRVVSLWQNWASRTSQSITSLLKVGKTSAGICHLRCIGQSIGTKAELQKELAILTSVEPSSTQIQIKYKSFFSAVNSFAGGWNYPTNYFKERSDYVTSLTDVGIATLLDVLMSVPAGHVICILNAYGGAINNVPSTATAFPHRNNISFCIHYYSQWSSKRETKKRMHESYSVFNPMRPFVTGGAYVNYCDAQLSDFELAYWGANLPRLRQIKKKYDPNNLFNHSQSITLRNVNLTCSP